MSVTSPFIERVLYNVIRPLAPEWFARRYTSRLASRAFLALAYDIVSTIGIHSCGPRRRGFGDFLRVIRDAGRQVSVVKCRDDFGAAHEAKQYWPDVLTVGAFTQFDGFPFDYAKFLSKARLNPWIDYWEILNEMNGQYADQANLYISLMPRMNADGLRLAMFSSASGTPPMPSEDGGAAYAEIARACKFAIDNRYPALLCLHEYVSSGGTIGRYRVLRDYLVARGAMLPVVISEWGFETHPGDARLMDAVREHDPLYMADDWIEGCATWTLGGGGWGASNYERALPQMAQYIATVPPVEPPVDEYFTASVTMHEQYRAELEAWVTERGGTVMD